MKKLPFIIVLPGDSQVAKLFRKLEVYGFLALEKIYRMASTRKNVHFNFGGKGFCEKVKTLNFHEKNHPLL